MKTKDILTIGSVALGTAALTVITFWSAQIEAGNEADAQAPKVAKPKLVANGAEMTLAAAEGRSFKAGDEPAFELTALNTTGEPATVTVRVALNASSPASMLSRVPVLPSMLWRQDHTLALKANEKKVITFSSPTKLPTNQVVSVSMQTVDPSKAAAVAANPPVQLQFSQPGIVALSFSTAVPVAQPTLAAAK